MKKIYLLFMTVIFTTLLFGCVSSTSLGETEPLGLKFIDLEVEREIKLLTGVETHSYAVFESPTEEKYYFMEITDYDYNNWSLKKDDTILVNKSADDKSLTYNGTYYAEWNEKVYTLYERTYLNSSLNTIDEEEKSSEENDSPNGELNENKETNNVEAESNIENKVEVKNTEK